MNHGCLPSANCRQYTPMEAGNDFLSLLLPSSSCSTLKTLMALAATRANNSVRSQTFAH
jgi:hypothetical protein